mmetsp:Transcript_113022/g.258899  ORF Transcript_113022/g.258899 Transcript_113022/m.258899 type:complete len:258 (+) Transcript_113022:125-898(+)
MPSSEADTKQTESQILQDENKPIVATVDEKQDDRPFHRKVLGAPTDFSNWLGELGETYDQQFLIMLGTAQWGVKGFMYAYVLTSMEWVYRGLGVPGPSIQIYKAVALLPWTMKPLFGVLSDCYPIMGYKKSPYIVLTSLVSLGALIYLFVVNTGITATTACLFFLHSPGINCGFAHRGEIRGADARQSSTRPGSNHLCVGWHHSRGSACHGHNRLGARGRRFSAAIPHRNSLLRCSTRSNGDELPRGTQGHGRRIAG